MLSVDQRAEQLLALLREQDPRLVVDKTAAALPRPETSIAQSSLFTGASHEPQMYTELKKEIVSADRIDMLVSFLSNAAISSGLEWNVKVTRRDLPETIDKIAATFESYWNSSEFEYYSEDQKERLARALKAEKYFDANNAEVYTMDIAPYSYQQEILDKLEAERTVRGYTRNLVVAATGTGKTVISALDYKRFCKQHFGKSCRLLFVAHREEILRQRPLIRSCYPITTPRFCWV